MLTRVFVDRPLAAAVIAVLAAGCQPAVIGFPGEQPRREDHPSGAPDRDEDLFPMVQSSAPPVPVRAQPAGAKAPGVRPAAARAVLEAGGFVAADEPAPTTAAVLEGGRLGHDPQVAVGERFLIVFTAHHYKMFDKATGRPLADEGEIAPNGDFGTLFSPLWSPRDESGAPNAQNINTRLAFAADDPLPCDPEEPTKSKACVNEFYDSRIMWDAGRKRFWIESAARNQLGFCNPPSKPCDKPWHTRTQARRYIAIAVSKTEDPRQGFHRYILVNQYTDWPKIAVNDHYLILGHRASSIVYVFDADKLAAGNPDRGPVRLAKLGERAFLGTRFLTTVTHHGPTGGMTYLLGSNGTDVMRVFALYNGDPKAAVRPVVLPGPEVDIGERLGPIEGNAIFRNGFLYWTRDEWAPGHVKEYRRVRVTRLPVRASAGSAPAIWASSDPRSGFLDAVIGERDPGDDPESVMDYEKPALDVNGSDDAVIVYSRKSFRAKVEVPPEVRYSILYHGEDKPRPGVLVRRGTTTAVPDINDNGKAGIDLSFAQVDPSDDRTVWITHAYADARLKWFKQVVAAVRP